LNFRPLLAKTGRGRFYLLRQGGEGASERILKNSMTARTTLDSAGNLKFREKKAERGLWIL